MEASLNRQRYKIFYGVRHEDLPSYILLQLLRYHELLLIHLGISGLALFNNHGHHSDFVNILYQLHLHTFRGIVGSVNYTYGYSAIKGDMPSN
jgi:hypothetical protein